MLSRLYVQRLKIVQTAERIADWRNKRQAENDAKERSGSPSAPISRKWLVFQEATDVTARFLPELQQTHQTSDHTPLEVAPTVLWENIRRQLIETLALAFPTRPKIEALVGQALQRQLPPGTNDASLLFDNIVAYCEAQGGEYLRQLVDQSVKFQPALKPLRAWLVDNGVIVTGRLDEAPPGGRTINERGEYVNSNGEPVGPPPSYTMLPLSGTRTGILEGQPVRKQLPTPNPAHPVEIPGSALMDINLTPAQRRDFADALSSAFPSYKDLERLVSYSFGWNLESIAGQGRLVDVIHNLLVHSEAEGYLLALLEAAVREKPGNPVLAKFASSLSVSTPSSALRLASETAVSSPPTSLSIASQSQDDLNSRAQPISPTDAKPLWKPWSDHPFIVTILLSCTIIGTIFTIASFFTDLLNMPSEAQPTPTATAMQPTSIVPLTTSPLATVSVLIQLPSVTTQSSVQASPTSRVRIVDFHLDPASPSDQSNAVCYVCTEGCGGVNVTIKVEVNTAADGSPNGEWVFLKEMDTPCYTEDNAPQWPNLDFPDGPHLVRVTIKDCDGNIQTAVATYELAYRQPGHPYLISPGPNATLTERTVTFQWQASLRATTYTLWVGTSEKPEDAPILHQVLTETSYTTTFATDYAQLYWRVDAQNDKGRTQVGPQSFSLISAKTDAILIRP